MVPEPYSVVIPVLVGIGVAFIISMAVYWFDIFNSNDREIAVFFTILMAAPTFAITAATVDMHMRSQWEDEVWQYVYKTYPHETYDVIWVKIDPEVAGASKGVIVNVPVWERDVVMTIVFEDDGELIQITNWHVQAKVADVSGSPVLEAMPIKQKLFGFIEPGYYDPVVLLPKDFEIH